MTTFRAQAIVFDNDGVLVDSHPQMMAAWTEVAQRYGLPADRIIAEAIGKPSLETLTRYLDGDTLKEANQVLEDLEIAYAGPTQPIEGALALVDSLPDGRWTIATSATIPLARARWQGAGIPVPERFITADDVTRGKPHPEPFVKAANLLGFDPTEVIVFEDSPAGGRAGLAAGATVIAVGDQTWDCQPHARVRDLSEVKAFSEPDGRIRIEVP